jgi:ABC-2 type transport system ATP-binding protein
MTDPPVALHGLTKRFARAKLAALEDVTTQADAGAVTGLIGPDAAGKTTLLRLIAGLLTPSAGEVRLLGGRARQAPGTLGYMPQSFGLYEELSVAQNLALYADLQDLGPDERRARRDEVLDFSGLQPFTDRLAGKLSGGMKQKLGLACVLMRPPKVLLLDEPSVGVDPLSRRELWSMVRTLADSGIAVVWSTAYLDEAANCDRLWMLHQGRLIADDAPNVFLAEVRGRCYRMPLAERGRRAVQTAARTRPGVLDAQVQGRSLRLLLAPDAQQPTAEEFGAAGPAEAVSPRFADAFVARLRDRADGADPNAGDREPGEPAPRRRDDAEPSARAESADREKPSRDHGSSSQGAPPEPAAPAIAAEELTRRFGAFTAVDRVSFEVARGEIFGLLGPNGAGKSTTFRMLCGLLPASGGQARVAGVDLGHARAAARERLGYMSQSFSLYADLSVRQNLKFFAGVYGLSGAHARKAIDGAIREFGLEAYARTNAGGLPLGYKQRLALAAAVMHDPAILFLDEPTSGVDPLTRREFWGRINAMAEAGVTVLVTSHFLDEAEYCDRLAIMHQSRVVALGAPDRLKRDHGGGADASLEDAFVNLIEGQTRQRAGGPAPDDPATGRTPA